MGRAPSPFVGASLLAKNVNDSACFLNKRSVYAFLASKLAPTKAWHSGRPSPTLDTQCVQYRGLPCGRVFEAGFLEVFFPNLIGQSIDVRKEASVVGYFCFVPGHCYVFVIIAFKFFGEIEVRVA